MTSFPFSLWTPCQQPLRSRRPRPPEYLGNLVIPSTLGIRTNVSSSLELSPEMHLRYLEARERGLIICLYMALEGRDTYYFLYDEFMLVFKVFFAFLMENQGGFFFPH